MKKTIYFLGNIIRPAAAICAGVLFLGACTKGFEELDYPKTTSSVIDPGPILTRSFVTGSGLSVGIWQSTNQLTTLDWTQYVSTIKANFTTAHYEPVPRSDVWSWWYSEEAFAGLHLCHHAIKLAEQTENPVTEAIARIWRVYMFQYMTDMYGDIPYTEAFESVSPKYDEQEYIYKDMIEQLQTAITTLSENKDAGYPSLGTADVYYGGNADKWIKAANSLLIRLAMQCSDVALEEITRPVLGSMQLDPSAYISSNEDNLVLLPDPSGPTYHVKNPYQYVASWDEIRISENFYSRLKEYDDPRMEIYMAPNADGEFVGLASGQPIEDLNAGYESVYKPDYCDFGDWFIQDDTPFELITASEISFLLAEAAFKGYISSGSAEDYYKKGIELSMQMYGIEQSEIDAFITRAAFSEENLYKQFWISLFPNGPQAWNLVRRTGKPDISPLIYHWPDNPDMPRRFSYSTSEIRYNPDSVNEAIARMGGDSQYTRMWWDKE